MAVLSFGLNAQKIGIKGGGNLSTLSTDASADYSMKPGVNVSVFFQKDLIPLIDFRPGIGYMQKGYKTEVLGVEWLGTTNYLQMDFDFVVKPPIIPIYLVAGPNLSYALSGTTKIDNYSFDTEFGSGKTLAYDLGLSAGLGYLVNLPLIDFFVEAKYDMGIIDIDDASSNTFVKNRSIMIDVGVMIGF